MQNLDSIQAADVFQNTATWLDARVSQPTTSRSCAARNLTGLVCLLLAAYGFSPGTAMAHDVADGVVERDVQVVVFPDRIELQYTLEMNSTTRDQFSEKAKGEESESTATGKTLAAEEIRQSWDDFRKQFSTKLKNGIRVLVDSRPVKLVNRSSETIEKHSIRLNFVLTAAVQAGPSVAKLEILDKNFHANHGYHRMAIKGRRGVEIQNATKPPIVSSLKRTPWSKLSEKEKKEACSIQASFYLRDSTLK